MLGINNDPVTIKAAEAAIIERAFDEGWVVARPPRTRTGKRVAIVGSGPAGLATADQLNRAGHTVTIFERAERIGGLLRYGIPEFKLEKRWHDRRLAVMSEAGVPEPAATSGSTCRSTSCGRLRRDRAGRRIDDPARPASPGRELKRIHFAMEFLTAQNRDCEGPANGAEGPDHGEGKHVVIIGGGDTGADCLGTVHRQGAASVHQLEVLSRPPDARAPQNPRGRSGRMSFAFRRRHAEGERLYSIATERFSGGADGRDDAAEVQVQDTSAFALKADLVLLAMGFVGPERTGCSTLGVRLTPNAARSGGMRTG